MGVLTAGRDEEVEGRCMNEAEADGDDERDILMERVSATAW